MSSVLHHAVWARRLGASAVPATRRWTVSARHATRTHSGLSSAQASLVRSRPNPAHRLAAAPSTLAFARSFASGASRKARSNVFSEHPFVFAGLAGIVVVGGYAAYMYSSSRYGVSNTTRFNIGGREVGCTIHGDHGPTVIVDMGTAAAAQALVARLSKFARVIAIDQQGQGASDIHPDGFSVPMLKVLSIASDIMGQPTHTRHTTDRAAAYTRAVETLKARAALHQQQQQQQQPPQQSSPSRPAAAPAPSPGGDKGDKMKLGMEHMHALVAALEKSPYAPPLTGVPATTAAKDIALLLNATKAEAPVVIVTFKGNWPTAAELAARNPDAVAGIVMIDSLQGPLSRPSQEPQSMRASDIVRTTQLLEDGLMFAWCGHGTAAKPPMERQPSAVPVPFTSMADLRAVFRHVVLREDVRPAWKWFAHVLPELGAARDWSIANLSPEAREQLANPKLPVTLCVTDPFLTPKGAQKLQWITLTTENTAASGGQDKVTTSIQDEVALWKKCVPHLRVASCVQQDPADALSQRWDMVASEVQRIVDTHAASPQQE